MKWTTKAILWILLGTFLSCKPDPEPMDINCYRDMMLGEWIVEYERVIYYQSQDSTIIGNGGFPSTFNVDGSGVYQAGLPSYFTWNLQCEPNVLLLNRINEPLEGNPDQYFAEHTAFPTYRYEITKMTTEEIRMKSEYFDLGSGDEKRNISSTFVYRREK